MSSSSLGQSLQVYVLKYISVYLLFTLQCKNMLITIIIVVVVVVITYALFVPGLNPGKRKSPTYRIC